jgi:glycosyltransferase involved in cell wall biosynthesis
MERDVPLVLVGHGTLEDQVLAALRTGDLPRVRFLGRKTPDEVRSILAGSIATVCPSEWYENFPYSVVQPMAAGKPVIGARVGGIPELVIPMETGFLIERRDARGLAEKMRQLWESPELARRLGAQAREHVRRLTDPEQHYDRIRQIFSIP